MPLISGATAAGFTIVRLLGCGQIGEVYVAEHPRLPRRHALKILPADVSADPEYRERFNRESDLAAALWHPHIVGLHDRGEFEGQLWLSLDYVDGANAAQLLCDTYPDGMPPDEVVEIVTAIADALDYAHDHGLLHRYVKPGNILIAQPRSDKRRILLADFGVARRLDDTNGLTPTNMTLGTVSYAAPEQLMGGSIDGRADQYALAGTAFHLLTGSPPFAHSNPAVVISKHLNESPPRPSDVRPELAHFDEPFVRALAKRPRDRFSRCRDFAKALEAIHSNQFNLQEPDAVAPTEPAPVDLPDVAPDTGVGDAATSPEAVVSGNTTEDQPVTSAPRRLPQVAAVALSIMIVVMGFVIVMALRSRSEFQQAPTNVETPSSVTTIPQAPPAPVPATAPPTTATPAPARTTLPRTSTPPSPPETTLRPTSRPPSPPETTMPPTTMPPSPPPTTPAAGLDTRPAVGMPCGPQQSGTTTVSNSGAVVSCVGTPGGFAWQSAGG